MTYGLSSGRYGTVKVMFCGSKIVNVVCKIQKCVTPPGGCPGGHWVVSVVSMPFGYLPSGHTA